MSIIDYLYNNNYTNDMTAKKKKLLSLLLSCSVQVQERSEHSLCHDRHFTYNKFLNTVEWNISNKLFSIDILIDQVKKMNSYQYKN